MLHWLVSWKGKTNQYAPVLPKTDEVFVPTSFVSFKVSFQQKQLVVGGSVLNINVCVCV